MFRGHANGLAVSGTSSPLTLATGAACVYGKMYHNDAALSLSVTTPVVGTTGGHVILRLDWTAQTVRALAVRNTDGVNSTPSLTQSTSTQWEIRLASFTITTGGVITVTDTRKWVPFMKGTANRVAFFDADGILSDESALTWDSSSDRLGIGTASPGGSLHVLDNSGGYHMRLQRSSATAREFGINVTTDGKFGIDDITGGSRKITIDTDGVGINGVTDPAYALDVGGQARISPGSAAAPFILSANGQGQRVDGMHADEIDTLGIRRQGGSASIWASPGTTNFTPADCRIECGTISDPGGGVTVTFPTAFAQAPIVIAQAVGNTTVEVIPGASSVSFTCYNPATSATKASTVYWIAIGPR